MKIVGMRFKDYLIFRELDLTPNHRMNVFFGKNRQGKTAGLKGIKDCLIGNADSSVIREGADRAELVLDLKEVDRYLQARRVINRNGQGSLTVKGEVQVTETDKKLINLPAPQQILGQLLGSALTFNPVDLLLLDGPKRTKLIRELFSVKITPETLTNLRANLDIYLPDWSRMDFSGDGIELMGKIAQRLYDIRTEKNRTAAQRKALYQEALRRVEGFDPLSFSGDKSSEINTRIEEVKAEIQDAETKKRQAEGSKALAERLQTRIADNQGWLDDPDYRLPDQRGVVRHIRLLASSARLPAHFGSSQQRAVTSRSPRAAVQPLCGSRSAHRLPSEDCYSRSAS